MFSQIMGYLILFGTVLLFLGSVTAWLKPKKPRQELDLPSHFVLQYAIGAAILACLSGVFNTPKLAHLLVFVTVLMNLMQLVPLLRFGRDDAMEDAGRPFKILQVNVLKLNQDTSRLRALIEQEKPDLIVAAEVRKVFADMFMGLRLDYPYQMCEPREKTSYGMAVLSKTPLSSQEYLSLDAPDNLAMAFRLMHEGKEIRFLSMHPATPNRDIASRDREFSGAVKHFGAQRGNIVVLGDLNATPYCHALKKLCRALDLKNAREGHGLAGSFPVFLPFWWLRLPIDHVLLGGNLVADDFRLGPDVGSDHYPTLAVISHANT